MEKTRYLFYAKVSPEESEVLQKAAFEAGYNWGGLDKKVQYTSSLFLFFDPKPLKISYSTNISFIKDGSRQWINYEKLEIDEVLYKLNGGNNKSFLEI